jgi:maleate isomerase
MLLAGITAASPRALQSQSRWEPDGLASIARIGVLTPDDDPVPESEMVTMAPKGVSIHGSRVPWNHDVSVFVEHAPAAVEMLARVSPRMILYAFTSSSYALGTQGHDDLRTKLEKRAGGIPVVLTCDAAVEGLRSVTARRVALFHPPWFAEDVTRKGSDYFRARGLDVGG